MVVINLNEHVFQNYEFLFSIHIGEQKNKHEIVFHRFILHNKIPCWCKKMGFLWKHGESCNERTFPIKFFHIILLLIYFQVWCKEEVVFFSFDVSIASIFELLCI